MRKFLKNVEWNTVAFVVMMIFILSSTFIMPYYFSVVAPNREKQESYIGRGFDDGYGNVHKIVSMGPDGFTYVRGQGYAWYDNNCYWVK